MLLLSNFYCRLFCFEAGLAYLLDGYYRRSQAGELGRRDSFGSIYIAEFDPGTNISDENCWYLVILIESLSHV